MIYTNMILQSASDKINAADSINDLNDIKIEFLGKSGLVTLEMKKISTIEEKDRKLFGIQLNAIKKEIELLIARKTDILEKRDLFIKLENERIDLTIPHRTSHLGSIHPITQAIEEMIQVFSKYGFDIKDGPNIEDSWHNFTALNIGENHPARQMHDTFYMQCEVEQGGQGDAILRTHTSPVQIRSMKSGKPPFRFISPGRTYRCDSDATHTPMFHQIEGVVIDKNINMGHLKYLIKDFIAEFFEQPNIELRFRPSFFPFTEPSAEVDIRMSGSDKWLEVLGCGMVHAKVLENALVSSSEYQGFAFGLGVERFAMLKYGIKDLRQFFNSDIRWIQHYSFKDFDIPNLAGGITR